MNVKNAHKLHVYAAELCRINRDDETIRPYFRLAGELNIAPGTVLIFMRWSRILWARLQADQEQKSLRRYVTPRSRTPLR